MSEPAQNRPVLNIAMKSADFQIESGAPRGFLSRGLLKSWTLSSLWMKLAFMAAVLLYSVAVLEAVMSGKWVFYVAVAVFPLVLLRPVLITVSLFAFLAPFDTLGAASGSSAAVGSTVGWFAGAAAGLVLIGVGIVQWRLVRPPTSALMWGLFALWGAMSLSWALNPAMTWSRLPSAVAFFFLYLAATSFRFSKQELLGISTAVALGGFVAAGYGIIDFLTGSAGARASIAIGQTEANPNDFASSLLFPFALALAGTLASRHMRGKAASLVALIAISLCIFLTMSRGSLLALAVAGLVFMFRLGFNKRVLIPAVTVLMLVFLLPSEFFTRMSEGFANRGTGRFDIWVVGLHILENHPILGVGLRNFPVAYNQFASYAPVFRGFDRDPHNIYLEVWTELGIIGLLLFGAAIWSQLKYAHTAIAVVDGQAMQWKYLLLASEAACWGLLAHGLAANLLYRKHFWLAWILLTVISTQVQTASREVRSIGFKAQRPRRTPLAGMRMGA